MAKFQNSTTVTQSMRIPSLSRWTERPTVLEPGQIIETDVAEDVAFLRTMVGISHDIKMPTRVGKPLPLTEL